MIMLHKIVSLGVLFGVGFAAGCERQVVAPDEGARACGGLAGTSCPEGLVCVDDPSDDCDAQRGGADCAGTCAVASKQDKEPKQDKECKDRHSEYVKTDPETCAAIRFKCHDGQVAFFDACGCGCETP